jgi:hypothetical protein
MIEAGHVLSDWLRILGSRSGGGGTTSTPVIGWLFSSIGAKATHPFVSTSPSTT